MASHNLEFTNTAKSLHEFMQLFNKLKTAPGATTDTILDGLEKRAEQVGTIDLRIRNTLTQLFQPPPRRKTLTYISSAMTSDENQKPAEDYGTAGIATMTISFLTGR
jgi:hypothetical protein